MIEKITLQTSDGIKIVGNFCSIGSNKAVLLLHMRPAIKESWKVFAEKLSHEGFASLAIDLRGHGESEYGPSGFENLNESKSIEDVRAAGDFLKSKGFTVSVIGASIGANLALQYQSENPDIKFAVLLSPGLNYMGVHTEDNIVKLYDDQKVLIVVSKEDEYSFMSSQTLKNLGKTEMIEYENKGHGTALFSGTDLQNVLIQRLKEYP